MSCFHTFKFSRIAGQWSSGTSSWILITKSVYPPCGVILTPDVANAVKEDHIVTAVKNNNVKVKPILVVKHTTLYQSYQTTMDLTREVVKSLNPQFGTAGSIQLTPEKKIRLVCVLYVVHIMSDQKKKIPSGFWNFFLHENWLKTQVCFVNP